MASVIVLYVRDTGELPILWLRNGSESFCFLSSYDSKSKTQTRSERWPENRAVRALITENLHIKFPNFIIYWRDLRAKL